MLDLSTSSERIARTQLAGTIIQCKIQRCQEQIKRVSYREAQLLRAAITALTNIQNHPDFHRNPNGYLREWSSLNPEDATTVQKISEVFEEIGDVVRASKL